MFSTGTAVMSRWDALLCLIGLWLTGCRRDSTVNADGCKKDVECKGNRVCVDGRCGSAALASSPQASGASGQPAASARPRELPAIEPTTIEAGIAPDGKTWLPKFALRREAGDQGRSLNDAYKACAANGLALCTEAQWVRACSPAVGSLETWTLTGSAEGFVVRGGDQGCAGRKVVQPADTAPTRGGVCCDRAIGIVSADKNGVFLNTTFDKLMRYETALNRRITLELKALQGDEFLFDPKPNRRDGLWGFFDGYNAGVRDLSLALDTCELSMQKDKDTWTAECEVTAEKQGKLAAFRGRFVWGEAEGKLIGLGELRVHQGFAK